MREALSSRLSGTQRSAASTTSTAIGRLRKKIQRQESASISQPPMNGPSAVDTPDSPAQAPIARPRSSGWKLAWSTDSDPGVSSAPPAPWRNRAAISQPVPWASPHSTEAAVNQTTPMRKMRRRPKRSPSAPPSSTNAASISR